MFTWRYKLERTKRLAAKGELSLARLTFSRENVQNIVAFGQRLNVIQKHLEFESGMTKMHNRDIKRLSEIQKLEHINCLKKWLDIFREGTSFITWNSIDLPDVDSTRCNSAWVLYLPTYSEGLRFQFDGNLHTNDYTGWSSQLRLSIFGAEGDLLVEDSGEDARNLASGDTLIKLQQKGILPNSMLENQYEARTLSWAFNTYLTNCVDFFIDIDPAHSLRFL